VDPKQFIDRFKSLTAALSPSQLVTIGGVFIVVVALVVGSSYWLSSSDYVLLFSDMEPAAASDVMTRLKAQKVSYQIEQGGRAIKVPANKADELRLDFAAQGLPTSGRIGFEIFDRTAFGATEFLEQVNYRRALEGEISRTILTIPDVSSARVHIAPAKDSLFGAKEQPAKASVVLKLKNPSRQLAASTVHGISSLVAASIEGLRPEAVVIVADGRPLTRPGEGDDGPLDGIQLERQQRIERDLTSKVVGLLEPVVGAERVRVNISARINPQSQEETEERWDPGQSVVRSKQTSQDGVTGVPGGQGVAGVRANMPAPIPAPAQAAAAAAAAAPATLAAAGTAPAAPGAVPMTLRSAETTNYEVSRVTRHTIRPRGEIARLSVAVIVDNESVVKKDKKGVVTRSTKPRDPAELQKMQTLVATAVGLDTLRGDQLTVENVPFESEVVEDPPPAGVWQQYGSGATEVGRVVGVILLGLMAFVFVVRPLMQRSLATLPQVVVERSAPQQLPRTVEEMQADLEAQMIAAEAQAGAPKKVTVLTKRLSGIVQKEPEHAARLVRTWLAEEEGR
jgi:flagellar M-ring protein FliF